MEQVLAYREVQETVYSNFKINQSLVNLKHQVHSQRTITIENIVSYLKIKIKAKLVKWVQVLANL
jgi:TATA-box binding protein (TBP) (component of TFIID and TFIIIB)